MRNKQKYITPLVALCAAAAIGTAPVAAAAPSPTQAELSCTPSGSAQTNCQSPGNVQVYVAPPQVDYFPYRGGAT